MSDVYLVHTDGGARPNPGPAAWAFVMVGDTGDSVIGSGFLGQSTNNIAEYTALVEALNFAVDHGIKNLIVRSDSMLLVQQINERWRVRDDHLLPLWAEAKELITKLGSFTIEHVRRELNKAADAEVNKVLDTCLK